jgi:DUF1680 family protein
MPVRTIMADQRISDDTEKVAIQRGPVIYCAEWPDNIGGKVLNLVVDNTKDFTAEYSSSLLGGTEIVKTTGYQVIKTKTGIIKKLEEQPVTLIPYALWNNRGPGQMTVWLPLTPGASKPDILN